MFNFAELLRQHETKTLEFKRDLSSPDKVMRTLVAFANGAGGVLLVGVEDGTRKVRGVPDVTKIEEQLANFISDRIEPRLVPEIHIIPWRKTHVLAVEVFPSPSRRITRKPPATRRACMSAWAPLTGRPMRRPWRNSSGSYAAAATTKSRCRN